MNFIPRRTVMLGVLAAGVTAACDNSVGAGGDSVIDQRVDTTLSLMYQLYPETFDLVQRASGVLVLPIIGKAGFVVGGSYGEGALRIDNQTVDYYSATQGTVGFQIGAQQYSQVLFFMTPEALTEFRTSPGWEAGANVEGVFAEVGGSLEADSTTWQAPVVALLFDQKGLFAGATVDGTKYTRIVR